MQNDTMFSSENQKWETRWEAFKPWDDRFGFTLDVCASDGAQKCDKYFSPAQNGLDQDWSNETFFCNPPYGREQIKWVRLAIIRGYTGVFLLPARTDTKLYHDYIVPTSTVEFIKGRLTFGSDAYWEWVWEQEILNGKENKLYKQYGKMNPAPFPSMLVLLNMPEGI